MGLRVLIAAIACALAVQLATITMFKKEAV
jgi:hypothetical protein